jgi:hypothetical protein
LRSITDTSYFPVEDLEQGPGDEAAGADAGDSSKDLAFLGYVLPLLSWPLLRADSFTIDIPSNASPFPMERSSFVIELSIQQLVCREGSMIFLIYEY